LTRRLSSSSTTAVSGFFKAPLEAAKELSSETELQLKWALTKIKESAPQALASS
jgi:hypothetical protein